MGHARPDTANVGDVLLAEPHRVRFAGRALLRGPLLRGGGRRRECEREAQKRRSGYDRPEVWLGTNVHYRPSLWFLSWYLLLCDDHGKQAATLHIGAAGIRTAHFWTRISRLEAVRALDCEPALTRKSTLLSRQLRSSGSARLWSPQDLFLIRDARSW
jgi:hypothetical protein